MPYLIKGQNRYNLNPNLAAVASSGDYNDLINTPDVAVASSTAPEFDKNRTYNEGEYVTYEGELYVCDSNGSPLIKNQNLVENLTIHRANYVTIYPYSTSGSANNDWDIYTYEGILMGKSYMFIYNSEDYYVGNNTVYSYTHSGPSDNANQQILHNNTGKNTFTASSGTFGQDTGFRFSIKKEHKNEAGLYEIVSTQKFTKVNLTEVMAEKATVDASINSILSIIAPEFDGSITYNEGDLFILDNSLYKVDSINGNPIPTTINLYDKTATDTSNGYQSNKYFNIANPQSPYDGSNKYDISEYIAISPNTTYYLSWTGDYGAYNDIAHCYYDSNKNYISYIGHGNHDTPAPKTLTTPNTAAYIRLSVARSNIDNLALIPTIKVVETTIADVIKELRNS